MPNIRGFVYIIESPSSRDLLDGRTEGRALSEALGLAEIPHYYSLASSKAMLLESLGSRLNQAWQSMACMPILHLSMHGNSEGISLTDGDQLSWHDLRQALLPLMRRLQGGLLVCMSSCFGSAGCRMAMYSDSEPHFWALVGNAASATWADAAIAYISFYHLFFKGHPLNDCVDSMKIASGDHNFCWFSGQETRAGWDAFMRQRTTQLLPASQSM